jgi:hypothetical protein
MPIGSLQQAFVRIVETSRTGSNFKRGEGVAAGKLNDLLWLRRRESLAAVEKRTAKDPFGMVIGIDPVGAAGIDFFKSIGFGFALVGAINGGVGPASEHRDSHERGYAIGSALLAARGAETSGVKRLSA